VPNHFKYFALHYLNLWLSQEQECHDALKNSSREEKRKALAKAAWFFRIARNLRTKHERGRPWFRSIVKVIDSVERSQLRGPKLCSSVRKVSDQISAEYGGRGALSATTKFLWLKLRSPIIIYDGQARAPLKAKPNAYEEFCLYYGDSFRIECPTRSGKMMNLFQVAREIANRLTRIFLRDQTGRRPVYGGAEKFQTDPHWKGLHVILRVLPWRQRRRFRRQSPNWVDGARSKTD